MTRSFQHSYRRWRPMVERSLAWLVADGCRRVPYRGVERNQMWWSLRVAAVNLRRLLVLGLARHDNTWVLAWDQRSLSGPILVSDRPLTAISTLPRRQPRVLSQNPPS
jgi:hypothetical protein